MDRYGGVMVGTSLDGVDVVIADIERPFAVSVVAFDHVPFRAAERATLLRLIQGETLPVAQFPAIQTAIGQMLANAVNDTLRKTDVAADSVRALGVHGPTLYHLPDAVDLLGQRSRGTFQLGDSHVIRAMTGIATVSDFRHADMARGGQGAPLVPFLDRLYFGDEKIGRILLNLGGIANATFLSAGSSRPVAFDTGPANMVIDALMERHPDGPKLCDEGGAIAASGQVVQSLLEKCLALPYFARKAPKSTGREDFGQAFTDTYFPAAAGSHADLVRTATHLTVRTVADAICGFDDPPFNDGHFQELIVAGGGVHNRTLMRGLAEALPELRVMTAAELGMNPDAKEAILMAALAWAYCEGIPGNVPSVTGASEACVLGSMAP